MSQESQEPLKSTATHPSQQKTIAEQLHENILEGDLLVSLFWSAMSSFRHDSILRPFPPMFVESGGDGGDGGGGNEVEGKKDIEGLVSIACIRIG